MFSPPTGGWLFFVIDVALVAILVAAIIYGWMMWRSRPQAGLSAARTARCRQPTAIVAFVSRSKPGPARPGCVSTTCASQSRKSD